MISLRQLFCFLLLFPLFLKGAECAPFFNQNDTPIIKEVIASKRSIDLDEKGKNFRLTGDIRADWNHRREYFPVFDLRGGNATDRRGLPVPADEYAVRMNLKFDYKCKDFYAFANIEWDDLMGIFINNPPTCGKPDDCTNCTPQLLFGSGFCDFLCLKRMFIGATVWKCEDQKIWVELGRKSLYYTFDSRIQYKARVDGIFSEYSDKYAKYEEGRSSEFAIRGGVFLVDSKSDHFSWAYEARLYNIQDSGFDLKYSMIDWAQHGKNACGVRNPIGWRFLNSQITLDYNFKQKLFGKKVNLYSAALMNHRGKPFTIVFTQEIINKTPILDDLRVAAGEVLHVGNDNIGAYLGFIIGEVSKAGDFSFDCNYQYVQAQAVPDCDNRGIGTGNFNKESFASDRRGNGNFKGIHMELLYAITDRLQLDINVDLSSSINRFFSNHKYHKYEVEFIHAF